MVIDGDRSAPVRRQVPSRSHVIIAIPYLAIVVHREGLIRQRMRHHTNHCEADVKPHQYQINRTEECAYCVNQSTGTPQGVRWFAGTFLLFRLALVQEHAAVLARTCGQTGTIVNHR